MIKGKSFSVDTSKVEQLLEGIVDHKDTVMKKLQSKMNASVNIVYATARARRPYVAIFKNSKKKDFIQFRGFRKGLLRRSNNVRIVSDPSAQLGVPVRYKNGGALRISINKEVTKTGEKVIGKVWTESPYAAYLEGGTKRIKARPFMAPALNENKQRVKDIFNAS